MVKPGRFLLTSLMALLSMTGTALGQFTYRSGVDVAALGVTVVDRRGAPIQGLSVDDFEVREDGALQTISYFHAGLEEAVPLHVGLMFDTSGSMEQDLAFSRNAAIRFLRTFRSAEDFTLVEFDEDVRAARFTQADFPRLVERIRSRRARGRTSLYDALSVYLSSAFDQSGRKVLVIYTDGGDTSSSRTWDEAVRILKASDVTVYAIGFMNTRGSSRLLFQTRLAELARLTGGRAVFPRSMKELEPVYAAIAREVETQYVIGYVPTNTLRDGAWRQVAVALKARAGDRLTVRTREGYFAPVQR
jgi:Ca-activated chloride channel family protein